MKKILLAFTAAIILSACSTPTRVVNTSVGEVVLEVGDDGDASLHKLSKDLTLAEHELVLSVINNTSDTGSFTEFAEFEGMQVTEQVRYYTRPFESDSIRVFIIETEPRDGTEFFQEVLIVIF